MLKTSNLPACRESPNSVVVDGSALKSRINFDHEFYADCGEPPSKGEMLSLRCGIFSLDPFSFSYLAHQTVFLERLPAVLGINDFVFAEN